MNAFEDSYLRIGKKKKKKNCMQSGSSYYCVSIDLVRSFHFAMLCINLSAIIALPRLKLRNKSALDAILPVLSEFEGSMQMVVHNATRQAGRKLIHEAAKLVSAAGSWVKSNGALAEEDPLNSTVSNSRHVTACLFYNRSRTSLNVSLKYPCKHARGSSTHQL